MENLSLSQIIQHNPDLLNIDSFLNQILSKITFEQFIAEIVSFPNIYDLISNKQEFWKQYYMNHHGPSDKSSQNVNWFFENFFKTKYYFTKGSSKNVATSIKNILDPKYHIQGGMKISQKNLLPISNIRNVILMDHNSYFLLNDGRLFELKNKEQKLITDNVKKILFRASFDFGGGNGFIIILKNSGTLWKYGSVPIIGLPSQRDLYELFELIFDNEENISKIFDINNINNDNYSFSIRTKTETLMVTSLEDNNDINIRHRLPIQSPIYSIIQRDMGNDIFTYCVFYTNDEISFFILSNIHDNIISFKRKLNMKINSLDIAYVPSITYLLQIVESFDDIDVNYYWINLSDVMFWKPTMFQDQTEYLQLVNEKFFPLLTRGKIESEKLIMDKNSDMGIKYIKINTMEYNGIVDNLYAIDKQDNIYEFNKAKEVQFAPIPSGREFFSGLGYLKEKIPKINRIFLSPISSYGFGQILELEYKTVLIHKMHFLYHTIMKQINKEQFSPDQKTVTYSLINSPYVFFANMM